MPRHRPTADNGAARRWHFVTADTPFGPLRGLVVGQLVGYSSLKAGSTEEFSAWAQRHLGDSAQFVMTPANPAAVRQFQADVQRLLHGLPAELTPDLSVNTPFQKQVAAAVQRIPFGHTASYGEIAVALGKPGGAQAVGQALPRLPFALFLPTHRVVRTTGIPIGCTLLTLELKTALLQWEQDRARSGPR